MKKLTDICDIQYGYAFDSKKWLSEEQFVPIQLLRIRDITRVEIFRNILYLVNSPKQYVLHAGDFTCWYGRQSLILLAWKDVDALLNQRVCILLTATRGN